MHGAMLAAAAGRLHPRMSADLSCRLLRRLRRATARAVPLRCAHHAPALLRIPGRFFGRAGDLAVVPWQLSKDAFVRAPLRAELPLGPVLQPDAVP